MNHFTLSLGIHFADRVGIRDPEQVAAHEIWRVEKVATSLADTRSPVSYDEAMARATAIIKKQK